MGAHVLVVEPVGHAMGAVARAIEEAGHKVRRAQGDAEALDLARGWVQVALFDVGDDPAARAVTVARLKSESPDAEVLLVADHAAAAAAAEHAIPNIWATLVRPFVASQLIGVVERAVRHVRTQRERNELMRRAQQAEKLATVGRLTAGLSHEIRNPLNAAALQLAVLERRVRRLDAGLQPPLLEPLTLVRDEIGRLEHIVQDFLHFARPAPLIIKTVALGGLLERVVALLSSDAERRSVVLTANTSAGLQVLADAEQLQQVFLNLALNGLDAAPVGGHVHLTARPSTAQPGYAQVEVEDSGPGIPVDVADRIFEPFFTTKAKGSGLGLPITANIVSQHGGSIVLATSTLGGARFCVTLPCAPVVAA